MFWTQKALKIKLKNVWKLTFTRLYRDLSGTKKVCKTGQEPLDTNLVDFKGLEALEGLDSTSAVGINIEPTNNASPPHTPEYVETMAENSAIAGVAIEDEMGTSFIDEDRYDAFNSLPEHLHECELALPAMSSNNENISIDYLDSNSRTTINPINLLWISSWPAARSRARESGQETMQLYSEKSL